jgi:hypothetical protein
MKGPQRDPRARLVDVSAALENWTVSALEK